MPDLIHLPRHDTEFGYAVDAYTDTAIQLEDAATATHPNRATIEPLLKQYLRLAVEVANHASGISGKYEKEASQC